MTCRHVMARIEAQGFQCCLQRSRPSSWQARTDDLECILGLVLNVCYFVLRKVEIECLFDSMGCHVLCCVAAGWMEEGRKADVALSLL